MRRQPLRAPSRSCRACRLNATAPLAPPCSSGATPRIRLLSRASRRAVLRYPSSPILRLGEASDNATNQLRPLAVAAIHNPSSELAIPESVQPIWHIGVSCNCSFYGTETSCDRFRAAPYTTASSTYPRRGRLAATSCNVARAATLRICATVLLVRPRSCSYFLQV